MSNKKDYLVKPSQFQPLYWLVEARSAAEALLTEFSIEKHMYCTDVEEVRKTLIENGFKAMEYTNLKEVFLLSK